MTIHIRLGLAFLLCASATTRLASQVRQDSLEERLEKAEEAIQRLQRQLDEQAQSWAAADTAWTTRMTAIW